MAGLTLVELMVVIAIVALLAGMAITSYQSYVLQARVSNIISFLGPYKNDISETFAMDGAFGALDSVKNPHELIDCVQFFRYDKRDPNDPQSCQKVAMHVYPMEKLGPDVVRRTHAILFTGEGGPGGIQWSCGKHPGHRRLPDRYYPSSCRAPMEQAWGRHCNPVDECR